MSKSVGNTILISDSPEEIHRKTMKAVTDPQKIRKGDPGRPEICLIFTYHQKFNPSEVTQIERECRSGALGCVQCKTNCAKHIADYLAPIREKRAYFEGHPKEVTEILRKGEASARTVAEQTMEDVHKIMKLG